MTAWQSLRFLCLTATPLYLALFCCHERAFGQLYDALDAHPPRWHLDSSDCEARLLSQKHLSDGGKDGRGCEVITFVASHGSEALLVYPIEPVQALDGLTANLSVMSARPGARIGLRVRFPYVKDKTTGRGISVVVYGASYSSAGQFASIGIGLIERALRLKSVAVRREYGARADLSDPYVDAIVVNAYCGLGGIDVDGLPRFGRRFHRIPETMTTIVFGT